MTTVKLKESEKRDMCLELARELKKNLWNMKVTVIPVVIRSLDTVTKRTGAGTRGFGKKVDEWRLTEL